MGKYFGSYGSAADEVTPFLFRMIKNNKLKKNWSTEDLEILVWLLSKFMEKNGI